MLDGSNVGDYSLQSLNLPHGELVEPRTWGFCHVLLSTMVCVSFSATLECKRSGV